MKEKNTVFHPGQEEIMSIGANIHRLREEKGFTQEKIAEMVDVSFQAVSSWERDEYKPDLDKLLTDHCIGVKVHV